MELVQPSLERKAKELSVAVCHRHMEIGIFEVDASEPLSLRDHLENVCCAQHAEAENFD